MRPSAGDARSSTAPRSSIASAIARCKLAQRRVTGDDVGEIGMLAARRDAPPPPPRRHRRSSADRCLPSVRPTCAASVSAAVSIAGMHAKIGRRPPASAPLRCDACSRRTNSKSSSGSQFERERSTALRSRRRDDAIAHAGEIERFERSVVGESHESASRLRRQLLRHQLVDERRVGLAARGFHHLPDEKPGTLRLSRACIRRRRFGLRRENVVDEALDRRRDRWSARGLRARRSPPASPPPLHIRAEELLGDLRVDASWLRPARSARRDAPARRSESATGDAGLVGQPREIAEHEVARLLRVPAAARRRGRSNAPSSTDYRQAASPASAPRPYSRGVALEALPRQRRERGPQPSRRRRAPTSSGTRSGSGK